MGGELMKKKSLIWVLIISIFPFWMGSCCFYPFPYWDYDEDGGYYRHEHRGHREHGGGFHRGEGGDQKIEKVKETQEDK